MLALFVVSLSFLAGGCADVDTSLSGVQSRRRQWEAARPHAYRFQVVYAVGGVIADESWWRSMLEITVVDNKPVQVRRLDTGEVDRETADAYPTIDGLFDIMQKEVTNTEEFSVRYDATHRYPDLINIGNVAADYGYQYAIYSFEVLDPDNLGLFPTAPSRDDGDFIQCSGMKRSWKQTRRLIENERVARQGLVCIWNVDTGELEMYGGDGDIGNDVDVSLAGTQLALFAPAGSSRSGLQLFETSNGKLLRDVVWQSDYALRTSGSLSHDATRYVLIEAQERVPLRDDQGIVSAFATRGAAMRLIDATNGADVWRKPLAGDLHFTAALNFSPDGRFIAVTMTPAETPASSLANDVVRIFNSTDGSQVGTHTGRFLAFSADASRAAFAVAVTAREPGTGEQVIVGHKLVLWNVDSGTDETLRESTSPHPPRFATFTPDNHLLVDVSANYGSVRLNLETIETTSGESLEKAILPAVPWGDKWSFSPDATTFARLGRTQTSEPLIEVHDIASRKLRRRFDFSGPDASGRPHVIGTATLIDANHLLTTHPEVIWRDAIEE